MSSKIKIVVFGGGGGIHPVIEGLKYLYDVTAVVTTSDDGGSSGELRNQGIIGVGDLRSALGAMARDDGRYKLVKDVFNHRFSTNRGERDVYSATLNELICLAAEEMNYDPYNKNRVLEIYENNLRNAGLDINQPLNIPTTTWGIYRKGHTLGNLILCYLILNKKKDWVDIANRIIGSCGCVLPNTTIPCHLYATFDNQNTTIGESFLDNPVLRLPPIKDLRLCRMGEDDSKNIPAYPPVIEAINQADVIVIAPGSFYASIIASLIPEGIKYSITSSRAPLVVFWNLFYDIHQTLFRYSGPDGKERIVIIPPEEQVDILSRYTGRKPDLVIIQDPNRFPTDPDILERYKDELGISSIMPEIKDINGYTFGGAKAMLADLARLYYQEMRRGPGFVFRHDPRKIEETFRDVLAHEFGYIST